MHEDSWLEAAYEDANGGSVDVDDTDERAEEELARRDGYCEDYPCCGHTVEDPCQRQWYDEPDAFDTRKHPHALCNHADGECNVDFYEDDEE